METIHFTPPGEEVRFIPQNNGGKTSYYDTPVPSREELCKLLTRIPPDEIEAIIDKIYALFPATLNDLIEYKRMQPWQHEIFKSIYAMNERAERSTDGSSGIDRELNKQQYYLDRGKKLLLR